MKSKKNTWRISGRAVVGLKHEERGIQCQDYVRYYQGDQLTIIALADGASSSNFAALGAKKSCHLIIDYFKKNGISIFKQKNNPKPLLITNIKNKLSHYAGEKNTDIYELSSTLLFVVIYRNQYIIGHVGDGVIGMLKNKHVSVVSRPENDEFANVTYFTSSGNLEKHLRIKRGIINEKDEVGFILMSDGTAKSFYNKSDEKFSSGVEKLFRWMIEYDKPMMNRLIHENLKNIIRYNTYDDCSLLLTTKT